MASQPSNPFTQRGAIRDPQQFFGREVLLRQIEDRLRTMQSVSIVGERRIGKSSLLHHIVNTMQGAVPNGVRLIYVDMQRVANEADFYTRLLEALGAEGTTFRDLERALEGQSVVACLDEFEKVADNANFTVEFFDGLRGVAQENLALITASQHSLADLCRDKKFSGSQFWNIFQRSELGAFSEDEAWQFMRQRFAAVGVNVEESELARALTLAGPFPFFLQMACSHLFDFKVKGIPDWEAAFTADAREFLEALWDVRTTEEKKLLHGLLNANYLTDDKTPCRALAGRGVLLPDKSASCGYRIFSEAFERIIGKPPKPTNAASKQRFSFRIKKVKITLLPPSIEIEEPGAEIQ